MATDEALAKAHDFLEAGNPEQAKHLLEDALTDDFDSEALLFALKCCNFWLDYVAQLSSMDSFERGESLVNGWKAFQTVIAGEEHSFEQTVYAVRKGVFTLALDNYRRLTDESSPVQKAEILRKTGLCSKKLGQYETALACLTEANQTVPGMAAVIAEMADCYALCGEEKLAKVLFREAFFIDPQKVDISFLDSELVCLLIKQVEQKGYSGAELQEWIPVYGVLYGVFNVKRELRSQEVGQLKQEIFAKENELKNPANNEALLKPRLINLYFRMIDHYIMSKDTGGKVQEILLKIRLLDPAVHEQYVK